jgi:hypothetical protein
MMHHSFVQLPDNNFKTQDMMVALHTLPILILIIVHQLPNPFKKNYIRRHQQKKDPSAAKSEAINPSFII